MSTPTDDPPGAPFLPPPTAGSAQPKAIAMALDEPELVVSTEAPYLPPSAPPKPTLARPQPFDAKAMVESTKRKVDNPVYGHLPAGSPEGRAAADAARTRMRRKRRRNKIIGWVMFAVLVAVVGGVSYALYNAYQDDQEAERDEREARAEEEAADGSAAGAGALSPVGEQAVVAEGLGDLNSGPIAGGGIAQDAINQAEQVVGQVNDQSATGSTLALDDVLPPEIAAVATEMQPLDGLTRYMIDVDDAARAAPLAAPGWLARLRALPQSPELSPGLTLVPAVGPGEIAIALQTDGEQVTRLVVLSTDPEIRVDL